MALDVLIVDDEADIRDLIGETLRDEGYNTRTAGDSDAGLKAIAERVPNLLILDIWLQGSELDGLGILEIVRKKYPHMPVVMISGHGSIETAVSSIKMGAYDFLEKPFKEDRLLLVAARALEEARMKQEHTEMRLRSGMDTDLTGQSAAIAKVKLSIDRVAPTNSRVMISGPAGVGKEVAARLIHTRSLRRTGPFVVFSPGSMSAERVEAELFGTEDTTPIGGADKLGVFERAHGGTLFIDQIGDMPMETQGKLLRALQEQSFSRGGGSRRVEVDVRVIAATNRDLQAEIEAGRFREDLYYRLNVVPVRIPPLRERREDIPPLCHHFLSQAARLSGMPMRDIGEDAMAVLQSYAWPGNVRQLRNVMEWLMIMTPSQHKGQVRANMLPPELFEATPAALRPDMNSDIMSMPLRDARELFERQYLLAQINRFGGNISRTSAFIGMERSALHRKLKFLGVHTAEEKAA